MSWDWDCVRSAGFEPAASSISGWPLCHGWSTSTGEPPPGADPGHPLYESGAAAVRGGVAAHRGFEPQLTLSESAVLPVERMGIVSEN
jgi:hypothetical protein